LLVLES
jgi:hypothetical protein